jgi:hypothetical protein
VPTVSIWGQVKSVYGRALPGVIVNVSGTRQTYAAAGRDGRYQFLKLPTGTYCVAPQAIAAVRFEPASKNLTNVRLDQAVDFTARPAAPFLQDVREALALLAQGIKLGMLGKQMADVVAEANGVSVSAIPGPGGMAGALAALLTGDPNMAMPPGVKFWVHYKPGAGPALFVSGRNVLGDKSVTWRDVSQTGACVRSY